MARLYNGFNALGIGQAIKNLYDDEYQKTAGNFNQFSTGLENLIEENRKRKQESLKNKAAADYARGVLGEDADTLAAFAPEIAVNTALDKSKTADTRKYNEEQREKEWNHEAEVKKDDRKYNEEQDNKNWVRKTAYDDYLYNRDKVDKEIEEGRSDLRKGLDLRKDMALQVIAKARSGKLRSRSDIEEERRVLGDLVKFTSEHPEFGGALSDVMNAMRGGNGSEVSSDDYFERLSALGESGKVDPKELAEFKAELVDNAIYDELMSDKGFARKWGEIEKKQTGKPNKRGAENNGAQDVVTDDDLKTIYANQVEMERLGGIMGNVKTAYSDETGKVKAPEISDNDLKVLWNQKDKNGKFINRVALDEFYNEQLKRLKLVR